MTRRNNPPRRFAKSLLYPVAIGAALALGACSKPAEAPKAES